MPLILSYDTADQKEEYLRNLFNLTYHKDVIERNGIKNEKELEILTKVMESNVGSLTNPNIITDTFRTKMKANISKDTVYSYLKYLEDAFIIYESRPSGCARKKTYRSYI